MNDNGKAVSAALMQAKILGDLRDQQPIRGSVKRWPVESPAVRRALVLDNVCPDCSGDLDTGWECIECEADHYDLAG